MKKIVLLFGLGLFLIGCSPKTTTVKEDVETLNFPNETVSTGYAIYGGQCTKCHKANTVKNYSREAWDSILADMAKRAKLSDDQKSSVDAYINWELAR